MTTSRQHIFFVFFRIMRLKMYVKVLLHYFIEKNFRIELCLFPIYFEGFTDFVKPFYFWVFSERNGYIFGFILMEKRQTYQKIIKTNTKFSINVFSYLKLYNNLKND